MNDDDRYRVDILLREYETLRAEVLQRIRNRWELVGFAGVAAGITANALSKDFPKWLPIVVLLGGVVIIGVLWLTHQTLIRSGAAHLVKLEERIHLLTSQSDADAVAGNDCLAKARTLPLLSWETKVSLERGGSKQDCSNPHQVPES